MGLDLSVTTENSTMKIRNILILCFLSKATRYCSAMFCADEAQNVCPNTFFMRNWIWQISHYFRYNRNSISFIAKHGYCVQGEAYANRRSGISQIDFSLPLSTTNFKRSYKLYWMHSYALCVDVSVQRNSRFHIYCSIIYKRKENAEERRWNGWESISALIPNHWKNLKNW